MSSIFMRFPGGKGKALTLSYDDAVQQDQQLVAIMNKHGLKGTFNINTGLFTPEGTTFPEGQIHRRMTEKEVLALYANSGHEVAVHGLTHPWLEQLPVNIASYEVLEDRRNIERLFGTITRGMAYPFGTYNDVVVDVLKAAGIAYSRTVISTESFQIPEDWLRLPATCHHDNPRLFELTDKFVNETPNWSPWLFYLWGHSYEFEEHDNWNVIEEFAQRVGGRDDIWYATNIEVYDYIQAYRQLRFSTDTTLVHNPTAVILYFACEDRTYTLNPGETIKLN